MALLVYLAGCAATPPQETLWSRPLEFPAAQGNTRLLIYGDVVDMLPVYDATPLLDLILYGPNDYGKTPLRNAQGLVQLGDRLLVCDQGQPDVIAISLSDGQSISWADPARKPRCPVDICTDGARVFVADTTNRAVLVYGPDGRFERELVASADATMRDIDSAAAAGAAEDAGGLRPFRPTAVRVREGILYAADLVGRRVVRYDLTSNRWLTPLRTPDGYPRMAAPTGLDFSPDGTLHIADSLQQRVLRVRDGEWLPPIGRPGRGAGQFVRPKMVCCTRSGLVLVTDAARQSILVFRSDGTLVTEIHETNNWKGFTLPAGLATLAADAMLRERIAQRGWPVPDELFLITDAMGGYPLLLAGTVESPAQEAAAGAR